MYKLLQLFDVRCSATAMSTARRAQLSSKRGIIENCTRTSSRLAHSSVINLPDAEKAYFVVEWSDEVGQYSVVPLRKIDSDGPFAAGDTVPVKIPEARGQKTIYTGKILSQGN